MLDIVSWFKMDRHVYVLFCSYGSPKRRGTDVNPNELPPPFQSTPARRYTVDDHHVSWLGFEFDLMFSSIAPLQLYNIRFNGQRSGKSWGGYFNNKLILQVRQKHE